MPEIIAWLQQALDLLLQALALLRQLLIILLPCVPIAVWFVFCAKVINWKKMAPALREGAWLPAVLLVVLVALVWSQAVPSQMTVLGFIQLPNFWWQLVTTGLLAGLGLFAGWMQSYFSWTPMEIAVEPPVHAHGGHGHGRAEEHGHSGH